MKKNEIWIESESYGIGGHIMKIGTEWGCCAGFKKAQYRKLFEAVKKAVEDTMPGVVVNPWSDDDPGTPDI